MISLMETQRVSLQQQSSASGGLGIQKGLLRALSPLEELPRRCAGMVARAGSVLRAMCDRVTTSLFGTQTWEGWGMAQTLQAEQASTKKPWALIVFCHGQQLLSLWGAPRKATCEASPSAGQKE